MCFSLDYERAISLKFLLGCVAIALWILDVYSHTSALNVLWSKSNNITEIGFDPAATYKESSHKTKSFQRNGTSIIFSTIVHSLKNQYTTPASVFVERTTVVYNGSMDWKIRFRVYETASSISFFVMLGIIFLLFSSDFLPLLMQFLLKPHTNVAVKKCCVRTQPIGTEAGKALVEASSTIEAISSIRSSGLTSFQSRAERTLVVPERRSSSAEIVESPEIPSESQSSDVVRAPEGSETLAVPRLVITSSPPLKEAESSANLESKCSLSAAHSLRSIRSVYEDANEYIV